MGKYDDQPEERSSTNAASPIVSTIATGPMSDGRAEDFASQGMHRQTDKTDFLISTYTPT